jgi:VWFA-related protein
MRPIMKTRTAHGALCAVCVLAGFTGAAAQQTVFRSGVDVVTADVTVVNGDGRPIPGLGADAFDVKVDGTPRRVVWAEFVPHRVTPLHGADAAPYFSTNEEAAQGRVVMVAVDQAHIRRVEGLGALRAATAFIDALDPADKVAAAPVNHTGSIQFTTDHAGVKRYLQGLTGNATPTPTHYNVGLTEAIAIGDGSRTRLNQVVRRECGEPMAPLESPQRVAAAKGVRDPCPVEIEQEARGIVQQARTDARVSIDALARLVGRLAELPGPKTLVLLSEGLVAEPQLFDLTSLGAAAQAARVTLYVLQLETPIFEAADTTTSPTMQADRQARADGLARLAGTARGALFHLVGADPYPFRRILTELSGYYLVAFEAADRDRDGRAHHIDVKARTPGATVRARPSFTIPAAPAPIAESDLVRLLRSSAIATEMPLRAAAYTFREPQGDRLRVIVSAEIDSAAPGRDVTIAFVIVDGSGLVVASGSGRTDRGRYSIPVTVPTGRYQLKVAAIDESGRQASVARTFSAVLGGSGAVRVSDLMLADPSAGEAPLRPAVLRVAADRVVAYLEAYAPIGWNSELSRARFEIEDSRGAAVGQPVTASLQSAGAGRWTVSSELAIGDVAPGSYEVAATIALQGIPEQRLTRPFVVVTSR